MKMKLTNELPLPSLWEFQTEPAPLQDSPVCEEENTLSKEPAVILELSFESLSKSSKDKANGVDNTTSKQNKQLNEVNDQSGRLTKMLITAKSKEQVQAVLSQAYNNLGDALKAAAAGDKDAMDIVKRLNKLIRRAYRKTRDLMKEDDVRKKHKRAEKEKLEQLSRQLEIELRVKMAERKQREKKYLIDAYPPHSKKQNPLLGFSSAALDAKIKMIELLSNLAHSSSDAASFHFELSGSGESAGEENITSFICDG